VAVISCLCVTHERHEFMPWVVHQFLKQHGDRELIVVDSSAVPWVYEKRNIFNHVEVSVRVVHAPKSPGISAKRTRALYEARGEYITWFDDDDWQSPEKCSMQNYRAVGARHAYMFSVESGKCDLYESTYEPIIFNSAVYAKAYVPKHFDVSLITGEDTDWNTRWLASRPTFLTLGTPMHAWLCHGKNITNKSNSRFFERENAIPFDEWELEFLRKQFGSPV